MSAVVVYLPIAFECTKLPDIGLTQTHKRSPSFRLNLDNCFGFEDLMFHETMQKQMQNVSSFSFTETVLLNRTCTSVKKMVLTVKVRISWCILVQSYIPVAVMVLFTN